MSEAKKKLFQPRSEFGIVQGMRLLLRGLRARGFRKLRTCSTKPGIATSSLEHAENCNGCMKCFLICPDFAIVVEPVQEQIG